MDNEQKDLHPHDVETPEEETDNDKQRIIEKEFAELEKREETLKTPEGMKEAVAKSPWGKGHAKCRSCGKIVDYDISSPKVTIKPATLKPHGSYLNPDPKTRSGFELSMPCPKGDTTIKLGKYYSRKSSLEYTDLGDIYSKHKALNCYISDFVESYRIIGEQDRLSKEESPDGIGFLDKR